MALEPAGRNRLSRSEQAQAGISGCREFNFQ
jgi:hypothetical protein